LIGRAEHRYLPSKRHRPDQARPAQYPAPRTDREGVVSTFVNGTQSTTSTTPTSVAILANFDKHRAFEATH
jgi:hypothetical protein